MFHFRQCVPAQYRAVEPRPEVDLSLNFPNRSGAGERGVVLGKHLSFRRCARAAQQRTVNPMQRYDRAVDLMRVMSLPFRPIDEPIAERLEDPVDPTSAAAETPGTPYTWLLRSARLTSRKVSAGASSTGRR